MRQRMWMIVVTTLVLLAVLAGIGHSAARAAGAAVALRELKRVDADEIPELVDTIVTTGEAIWANVPNPLALELEDRQGVIVRARPGAQVLGVWSDSGGMITHPSVVGSAVVQNGRSIYVAPDMLSWHTLQRKSARTFLGNAIAYLLSK